MDGYGNVHWDDDFSLIGSGSVIAKGAMCQRDYDNTMPLMECLYRIYEAKRLAEIDPHVGQPSKFEIMLPTGRFDISDECFKYLNDKFRTFGPKPKIRDLEYKQEFLEPAYEDVPPKPPADKSEIPSS